MRPILAAAITTMLLVCTWAYVDFVERVRPPELEVQENFSVDTSVRIRILRTFDCVPGFDAPAMRVTFRNRVVFETEVEQNLPSAQPIEITLAEQLVIGDNAIGISLNAESGSSPAEEEWGDEPVDQPDPSDPNAITPSDSTTPLDSYSENFDDLSLTAAPMAYRVTVFRGSQILTDRSFWISEPGEWTEEVRFVVDEESP